MASLPYPARALLLAFIPLMLAFGAQYGLDIRPCFLCHLQRLPWIGLVFLAGITWAYPSFQRWSIPAAWILIIIGLILAGWHYGIEENWLPQPSACKIEVFQSSTVEELLHQIYTAPPNCAQRSWSPIGISWPLMNAIALIGAAVLLRFRHKL